MGGDDEIPEENPEFVSYVPEHLPAAEVRDRVAQAYRDAVAEHRALCSRNAAEIWGNQTHTFLQHCRNYMGKDLRDLRWTHPVYKNAQEDLEQEFLTACLELLKRQTPLEDHPTCCLGTQIYNSLGWRIRAMARKSGDILGIHTDGSDVLDTAVQKDHQSLQSHPGESTQEEIDIRDLHDRLRDHFGQEATQWMWGRYMGNSLREMQSMMDLGEAQAQRVELVVRRFLTQMYSERK